MLQADIILKKHLARLVNLTEEEFAFVYKHFKPLSLKKGQTLISFGEKVKCEYFVLAGCLKSFQVNAEKKMVVLQLGAPTWWISDYHALYYHTGATISVDCVTDAEVLVLNAADREKLCSQIPQFERFFRWRTNRGYVALQKRLLSFMNKDAKDRYEEFVKMYPELYAMLSKKLIAAYLGVSRETLSRFGGR